jgi:hypothetical protein
LSAIDSSVTVFSAGRSLDLANIARFSQAKDRIAILGSMEAGFDVTGPQAIEIPLAVRRLISLGISHLIGIMADST